MKRNYVKVIAAVVGMTMVYCPLTLNAKSKKNATAAPSEIAIHGYGDCVVHRRFQKSAFGRTHPDFCNKRI